MYIKLSLTVVQVLVPVVRYTGMHHLYYTYIHTYIHTYCTYIHTYIHRYFTYIHGIQYIHTVLISKLFCMHNDKSIYIAIDL